ncbi:tryptophan synthase alpha chain [Arcticibacter tournemirensis]|uniref:Tryptophan synthase alpha chain n=1 Tax=Arcticibacter tournemirensis TaxID=699437 RepID=A0A5M9HHH3_9SPHI|nr:tryptophan synthase subunit alpha [Arcticibacter tournemirensis]KAA8484427.1 tryptophan synthase subunit alpha [Arcticibacter tournemirensis]TQM49871.1 tryptophan synthase alpha chain [Arcticibacter tournemirensis]
MNRIKNVFEQKKSSVLSIFFTAGYPDLNSTVDIAEALEKAGADFLEIGIPYSDPLADGPVIQNSSQKAIENGMTVKVLFEQLKDLRKRVSIPVLLMGYVNPVLQYGVERFCSSCVEVGVDGLIVPDLPMYEYEEMYRSCFESKGLSNIFLITPHTSDERIRKIDELSNGFIYLLSSSSTTGKNLAVSAGTEDYFGRIKNMKLRNPTMIGFGISDNKSFSKASEYANGAIVGSAFVRLLDSEDYMDKIPGFIQSLKNGQ